MLVNIEAPDSCPKYLAEGLDKQSPETLDEIGEYARALAEQKRHAAQQELEEQAVDDDMPDDWDDEEWAVALEESGADGEVPSGATLTTKEIKGRQYYYWQWREGEIVKSKYVRP